MCVYVLWPSLMSLTYITLKPLSVFDLSSTSSICLNVHSIWWYGSETLSLSFSKMFSGLKISWILRKLWAKCVRPIQASFNTFDIQTLYCIQGYFWQLWHTLWSLYLCIYFICITAHTLIEWSHCYSIYTQWLLHYLIQSRSKSILKN